MDKEQTIGKTGKGLATSYSRTMMSARLLRLETTEEAQAGFGAEQLKVLLNAFFKASRFLGHHCVNRFLLLLWYFYQFVVPRVYSATKTWFGIYRRVCNNQPYFKKSFSTVNQAAMWGASASMFRQGAKQANMLAFRIILSPFLQQLSESVDDSSMLSFLWLRQNQTCTVYFSNINICFPVLRA